MSSNSGTAECLCGSVLFSVSTWPGLKWNHTCSVNYEFDKLHRNQRWPGVDEPLSNARRITTYECNCWNLARRCRNSNTHMYKHLDMWYMATNGKNWSANCRMPSKCRWRCKAKKIELWAVNIHNLHNFKYIAYLFCACVPFSYVYIQVNRSGSRDQGITRPFSYVTSSIFRSLYLQKML